MKISSNIYNLTYGLIVHQPKVNCEALIEGKNLIGYKIISTSPYLTSSDFSNCPIREWKEYLDFCIKLYKKILTEFVKQ